MEEGCGDLVAAGAVGADGFVLAVGKGCERGVGGVAVSLGVVEFVTADFSAGGA